MAMEDHPKYAEWRAAYDRYVAIESEYVKAIMLGVPASKLGALKAERDSAFAAYKLIADNIE